MAVQQSTQGILKVTFGLLLHQRIDTIPSTNAKAGTSVGTHSMSHHGQTASLLPDDSTAAQEACNHHQAASQDKDIRRHSKSAGCQQTRVVTFLQQCPDSYTQNSRSTHLEDKGREEGVLKCKGRRRDTVKLIWAYQNMIKAQ